MFNIIIFGPPGSGKGTQSVKIAEKYGLTHISTGDIFRSEIKARTALGLRVVSIIEQGALVPDELLLDLLKSAMDKHPGTGGFLFDGYPRTLQQANDLEVLLQENNTAVNIVLALDVQDDELMQRLLNRAKIEGRKDDTETVIANRLGIYHSQTKPLMDHYDDKGKLEQVQGTGSIEEIFNSLCNVIDSRIS
ncbi:MAG: adenylate kinase [Bacteroidetes bacterium]|nr:adenylate kinase [Bacteroidota bacterium]